MRAGFLLALLATLAAGRASADAATEPSERVCNEFRTRMQTTLAAAPDSLQVNNLLFEAAHEGCARSLDALFAAGASRLARDREGATALAIAARAGRKPVVEALLAGASEAERRQLDAPEAHGATPLMLAIHSGRSEVARLLIAAGARVDAIDAHGETALSEAAFAADEDVAELLLQHGAKPDASDRFGKTPICYAAARGAARLVGRLIDAGVDPNAAYGNNLTALMWAAGHPDLTSPARAVAAVQLLIARGAKLDLTDDRGRTALMIAAALNRFETAEALIAAGADRTIKDKAGKTAADLAATDEMRAALK
jgi:ankyrin repeat protein